MQHEKDLYYIINTLLKFNKIMIGQRYIVK